MLRAEVYHSAKNYTSPVPNGESIAKDIIYPIDEKSSEMSENLRNITITNRAGLACPTRVILSYGFVF
jgi:hypothetical protein